MFLQSWFRTCIFGQNVCKCLQYHWELSFMESIRTGTFKFKNRKKKVSPFCNCISHNFEPCDSWNFRQSLVSWIVCFKQMDIYIKGVNRQTKVTGTFFTQSGKEKERIFANKWEDNSSSRYHKWLKTLVWTADIRKREFSNNWTKKIMGKKGFFKKK